MVFLPPCLGGPKDLPESGGPFVPGWVDILTGSGKEDGALVRIYYPTSLRKGEDHSSKWTRWLAHGKYVEGFAYLLGYWTWLIQLLYFICAGNKRIPAARNGPVADIPKKIKTAVFSHGMGGTRFLYTGICCEVASHGYVVVAPEHRDGSASMTCYYSEKEGTQVWEKYTGVPRGTKPAEHLKIRAEQVEQRASEAGKALELLKQLNNGVKIINKHPGSNFDLSTFKDRLDFDAPVMMGQSFGGATTLLVLTKNSDFKCGIIFDPWMFPLHRHENLPPKITQPLLCVNMQAFQTTENLRDLHKYMLGQQPNTRESYTIKGTTHENQSDTVHLIGYWLNFFMKKIDPVLATRLNSALIIKFLKENNGLEIETEACKILDVEKDAIVPETTISGVHNKRKYIPHQY